MGRTKDHVIEAFGGFDFEDFQCLSNGSPSPRMSEILKLEKKVCSGRLSESQLDNALARLRALKGLPPDEFDYEPKD
jgi:hypothetical protein